MQNLETFYKNYELRDSGDGRRLEKFGKYLIDRPASQALYEKKLDPFIWGRVDFSFYDGIWHDSSDKEVKEGYSWEMEVDGLKLKLGLSEKGQVGVFPEQFVNWNWIYETITDHLKLKGKSSYTSDKKFSVLNGFAYTGGASLFSAKASKNCPSEVCHLDGSKSVLNWAGDNARLNELSNIRWIVDDVLSFLKRELKREKFYDAIILDPPAFGRGKGKTWSFKKDMEELLDLTKTLMSPAGPVFFMLSCHDTGIRRDELKEMVSAVLSIPVRFMETVDLEIDSPRGNPLHCGVSVRFKKP